VQCYDQNKNVNEWIIQSTQDTHNNSDEDTDKEPDPPIQLRETKKSLEILRIFFLQRGNEGSLINDLDACSDKIRQQSIISKKQQLILIIFLNKIKEYLCYVCIFISNN